MCRECRDCGGSISVEGVAYEDSFAHRVPRCANEPSCSAKRLFARREYAVVSSNMEVRAVTGSYSMDEDILRKLEGRLGPLHAVIDFAARHTGAIRQTARW
jgi:hypothetical protein